MHNTGLSTRWCAALTAAFVSFVSVPFLGSLFGWDFCRYVGENRTLSACPSFSFATVRAFPQGFEAFYKDRFGFRNAFIRGQSILTHKWLMLSSSQVILGKDGWLYLTRNKAVDDFAGQNLFDSSHLSYFRLILKGRQAWLARRGIKYLFVVVPDKRTIYPEYLPDYILRAKGRTRLEQLSDYMRDDPGVNFLDLTEVLRAGKSGGRLFYRDDDHWTPRGKFVGCEAIRERLAEWFPGMRPWRLEDYRIGYQPEKPDLLALLGTATASAYMCERLDPKAPPQSRRVKLTLPGDFIIPQKWTGRLNAATENKAARGKLVVFSDSFLTTAFDSDSLLPLTENFRRLVFLDMRTDYRTMKSIVEQEHPDAVVEEWAQYMLEVPPDHPEWDLAREASLQSGASPR